MTTLRGGASNATWLPSGVSGDSGVSSSRASRASAIGNPKRHRPRTAASVTWRLRLQPTPKGWVDMGLGVPLLDSSRARSELGCEPRHGADEALLELLEGIRTGERLPTPALSEGAPS